MLMTYPQLIAVAEEGVILGGPPGNINGASIDVTLGRYIWTEDPRGGTVDLSAKDGPAMTRHDLVEHPYLMRPGEFVLAQTHETFNLPNTIAAEFKLKSSTARAGLQHALAGWADPGWHGSVLTLELTNSLTHHRIALKMGVKIGQMVFYQGDPVPDDASYATRGRYNGDQHAQPSRGVR